MNDNLHKGHRDRLREKALKAGLDSFSEHEVLELMLSFILPRIDTNPIAHNLINKFGNLQNVVNSSVAELTKVNGIGLKSAKYLIVMSKFVNYYSKSSLANNIKICDLESTKKIILPLLEGIVNEEIYLLCVSSNNRLMGIEKIGSGTSSFSHLEIKKLNKVMSDYNCSNFIICHNHPNGDCDPSGIDDQTTKSIVLNSLLNGYNFMDHVIVGTNGTYSYFHSGILSDLIQECSKNQISCIFASSKAKYGD